MPLSPFKLWQLSVRFGKVREQDRVGVNGLKDRSFHKYHMVDEFRFCHRPREINWMAIIWLTAVKPDDALVLYSGVRMARSIPPGRDGAE
jgi:hypothetical protein